MTVLGVDVSNYQGHIDWEQVAGAGIAYAWVLATDGSRFFDSYYPEDVAGAQAHGIAAGGYHFARPDRHAPDVEAAWYRAHAPAELQLPTALDMEADWLPGRDANTDWALRFFDAIAPAVRVLYTNGDGATRHLDSTRLVAAGVELWYAHPGHTDFAGVAAWPSASAVQYGSGAVPGIAGDVDLDAMPDEIFARWVHPPPIPPQLTEEHPMETIVAPDGTVYVFVIGTNNAVWERHQPPGKDWTPWADFGGQVRSPI